MKIKALFLAVSIFGATFFVTSNTDNDNKNEVQKNSCRHEEDQNSC